jgi:hypothetical protein
MSLRRKALISVALLLASASVASAKDPVWLAQIEPPRMAADPPRGPNEPLIEGEITAAKALRAIYGNYDTTTESTGWLVNFRKVILGYVDPDEKPQLLPVTRLADQVVSTPGHERYLLLTSLGWPRGQSFRPMQPAVGGAIFERTEEGWRLAWSRRFINEFGDDQAPPRVVEPVRIGKSRMGFVIHSSDSSQGYTFGRLSVFAEVKGALKEVLDLHNASEDNAGDTLPDHPGFFRYHSKLIFVPGGDPKYFDIVRRTSGTYIKGPRSIGTEYQIRQVKSTARYVFRDGRYQPLR